MKKLHMNVPDLNCEAWSKEMKPIKLKIYKNRLPIATETDPSRPRPLFLHFQFLTSHGASDDLKRSKCFFFEFFF